MSNPVTRYIVAALFFVIGIFRFSTGRVFGGFLSWTLALVLIFSKPKDKSESVAGKISMTDWERHLTPMWYDLKQEVKQGTPLALAIINKARQMGMPVVFLLKHVANRIGKELERHFKGTATDKSAASTQLNNWTRNWTTNQPADGKSALLAVEPEHDLLFSLTNMNLKIGNGDTYNGLMFITRSHLIFVDLPAGNPENDELLEQLSAVPLSLGASEGEVFQVGLFKKEILDSDGRRELKLPAEVRNQIVAAYDRNLSLGINMADVKELLFEGGGMYSTAEPLLRVTTSSPYQFQWAGGKAFALHQAVCNAIYQACWLSSNPLIETEEGSKGEVWLSDR